MWVGRGAVVSRMRQKHNDESSVIHVPMFEAHEKTFTDSIITFSRTVDHRCLDKDDTGSILTCDIEQ